jgi:repressor LexA
LRTPKSDEKRQDAALIGARLKAVRKSAGFSLQEIAERLNRDYGANINKGMISKYENGIHAPSAGTIHCLAKIFGVSADYLMCKTDSFDDSSSSEPADTGHMIKIYLRYNLIDGGEIDKDCIEFIPSGWLSGGHEFFGLRITGSEFAPRYFEDDIVIFERRSKITGDRIGLVSIGSGDAFLCHIVRKRNGKAIIPIDRRIKETFYTTEQLEESGIHIIGVAVQLRRFE